MTDLRSGSAVKPGRKTCSWDDPRLALAAAGDSERKSRAKADKDGSVNRTQEAMSRQLSDNPSQLSSDDDLSVDDRPKPCYKMDHNSLKMKDVTKWADGSISQDAVSDRHAHRNIGKEAKERRNAVAAASTIALQVESTIESGGSVLQNSEKSLWSKRRKSKDEAKERTPPPSTSSSEDENSPLTKKMGRKKSYNKTPFNYERLNSYPNFKSLPIGKPPYFDGTHYIKWRHLMKMYLTSLHPSIWKVVRTGIKLLDSDDGVVELTPYEEQAIHRNAQAVTVLLSSLSHKEFKKVYRLEIAKDIWDTLKVAHMGTKSMREAKIERIEGELERFIMEDDETPQEMYDRLMKLVNMSRAYGCKKWTDHEVVKRMIRAFTIRYSTMCMIIRESDFYMKMTPEEVLGKIMSYDMMEKEAQLMASFSKSVSAPKNKDLTIKASKKSKKKQDVKESSSGEEDIELLIRKFIKFMKKKRTHNDDKRKDRSGSRGKRACYNCGKSGHFIANCPHENKEEGACKKNKEKHYVEDKKAFRKKSLRY